ncbi:uncharacterized protein [Diadema setosum]|uniref:uncharacterized protein n=1 Tax=Diadema setosum TaxID=31175 RepID=UPI003B3AA618
MATGDIRGNLHRLQSELKHARYPKDIDYSSLARGSPADFLPILHYVMCDFSRPLSELILDSNIDMVGKSDRKFLEATYKALRDLFSYKPCITAQQFFSKGFAERKILLMIDVVAMVRKKHKSLSAKKGPSASQSRLGQGDASKSGRKPPSPGAASLPQLSEISAPEEFRPSLNSTTSECLPSTPTTPTTQTTAPTENGPSVEIVVVGHTPAPPNVKVVKQSSPDQATQSTATYRAVIHDDELKTHPVIRDLAVVVGDLMNRVQTLEEQVTRLTVSTKKEEQRGNARWVLLENNFNILEGQLANKGLLNTKPPESQQTFLKGQRF